jgi:hypothetical protein
MLNKSLTIAALSGLALSSTLSVPANAASFYWSFNGDGYGEATLSFDEATSPQFLDANGTGVFTAADLGDSATFNYYLDVQGDRFSATDFSGVNPDSLTFTFENGNLTGYDWTDIGDNLGWSLTVTPDHWSTFDPTYNAPSYSLILTMYIPSEELWPALELQPAFQVLPSPSAQSIPESSSPAALLLLGAGFLLKQITSSSRLD